MLRRLLVKKVTIIYIRQSIFQCLYYLPGCVDTVIAFACVVAIADPLPLGTFDVATKTKRKKYLQSRQKIIYLYC